MVSSYPITLRTLRRPTRRTDSCGETVERASPWRPGGIWQSTVVVVTLLASWPVDAQTTEDGRIRIVLRSANAIAWNGEISVLDGQLVDCAPLGTEPQVAGSVVVGRDTVVLQPQRPSVYQALDVTVASHAGTQLQLRLRDPARADLVFDQKVSVDTILREGIQIPVDDKTLVLARGAPGDDLRVQFARDQLVFSPRELWQLDVTPARHVVGPEGGKLVAELYEGAARRPLWRTQTVVPETAPSASTPAQRLTIPIPDREGVYHLALHWTSESQNASFGRNALSANRHVQFVVIENQPPTPRSTPSSADWPTVFRLQAGQADWWKRTASLPRWNRAGSELDLLLRLNEAQSGDTDSSRIDPGEHHVEVLSLRNPGRPHILELTCQGESGAGLMVAMMESDEQGQLDWHNAAGSFTVNSFAGGAPSDTYRMLFWPRTRRPVVYLSNVQERGWIQLKSLRVLEGPTTLPSARTGPPVLGRRKALLWISDPHLLNTFSPSEWRDPATGRSLTDWTTFLTLGRRLADYLKFQGYSGASLNVWCDGGAIFPAASLQGSSRWDTGAYLPAGQDPVPKDILELYLRIFDREGLTCVPGLCFNSRLPALEKAIADSATDSVGIDLVHRDGRSWRNATAQRDGRGPFYNPLDRRVQDAMIAVVRELAQRYRHHPSFAGIQIDLAHDSFAVLPNSHWGFDRRTLDEFRRTMATGEPNLVAQLSDAASSQSHQWRAWRCRQLTSFYARMLRELQAVRPDLQLHLATGKLAHAPSVSRSCAPALPRQLSALVPLGDMGVDPSQLAKLNGIVLARPWVMDAADSLIAQGPLSEWNRDGELDTAYLQSAALLYERIQIVPFRPDTDAEDPPPVTRWLIAPTDRLGVEQREPLARALVNRDCSLLIAGGSQPSLGELDVTREFLRVFNELPADPFHQPDGAAAKPVVLRTCSTDGKSYLYVVNPAPWPVDCQVHLRVPRGTRLIPISAAAAVPHVVAGSDGLSWRFTLEGYGLEAAMVPVPEVVVAGLDVEQSPEIEVALRSIVTELIARMPRLQSLESVTSLVNPGFERSAPGKDEIDGWDVCREAGVRIELDDRHHVAGETSLRMQSQGNAAWVRSHPLGLPRTGRLSLHLQLRRDPQCRAPLRLAVEGTTLDEPFYRYAEITSLEPSSDPDGWAPIVLQITDLPDKQLDALRVRFDLLGAGEVWIDDVRLDELSFTPKELNELSKVVALADLQLSEGELARCHNTLRRYWPRYLLTLVPPPPSRMASQPAGESRKPVSDDSAITLPKLPWR